MLAFIIASVAAGLALLVGFGAPGELSGYIGCMLGSVAVLAAITTVWKVSIHCAVAAGSVTILALLFGPWLTPAYLLVALTAWSRVVVKDHTAAQVIAGSLLGVAAAIVTYAIIPHLAAAGIPPQVTAPRCGRSRRCSRWPAGGRRG